MEFSQNRISCPLKIRLCPQDQTSQMVQGWILWLEVFGLHWKRHFLMSNENKALEQMYSDHEKEKKRLYNSRVIEVEHGTFTPLVFSTTGGMSRECTFLKKLSKKLSQKSNQKYSDTISFVRRRLRVELLRTCLIAIRGHRDDSLKGQSIWMNQILIQKQIGENEYMWREFARLCMIYWLNY